MNMRVLVFVLVSLSACGSDVVTEPELVPGPVMPPAPATVKAAAARSVQAAPDVNPRLLRRFKPLRAVLSTPDQPAATPAQVDLGRMLFFDKRLSKHRDLACNSCHALDKYGVDNQPTSTGAGGKRGRRNSPTVYQAAGHLASFWDGRAANVEQQAKVPILDATEMAMPSADAVVAVLTSIPGYAPAFRAAFPDQAEPLTYDNVGLAIGAFERRLVTPSRWDRYVDGDTRALTPAEVAGLKVFTDVGCVTCHTGELVGGSMFQKVGVAKPWPRVADEGRGEVSKLAADRMVFKVPSLRNVTQTAPYFSDGSTERLDEAVVLMARYQIGEELSPADVSAIVAWLGCLTGELPRAYIQEPALPADGPTTGAVARD